MDGTVMKYMMLYIKQYISAGCISAVINIWLISNIKNIAVGDNGPSWTTLIAVPTITAIISIQYTVLIAAAMKT